MKIKRLLCAFMATIMVGVHLGGIIPVFADDSDPTIQNEPSTVLNGDDDDPNNDIILSKVVESVPGWANKWKVTLRIEAPAITVTSDTVLVIDQSNSMKGDRLTEAKAAADSLAKQLLPEGNTVNRIAVLSFGSEVYERTGFSNEYSTVSSAIRRISADGGTFTQAGLHDAVSLIESSSATYKNIILLSDGVPTYSYRINDVGDHLQSGGPGVYTNQMETTIIDDQSDFDYTTRVGNGGSNVPSGQEMWYQYWSSGNRHRYYNHGNSTISEANFFNVSGNGTLWTIAFNAGTLGNNVLSSMASSDENYYVAGTGDLEEIFNAIAGSISSLINNASVHDTMGVGVTTMGEDGAPVTELDWEPEFELVDDKYVAEYSYEVEMNEDVFTQTASGGFYALNDSAVLTYSENGTQKTGEFPVPKAKPFDLDVEKVLTVDGEEKVGEEFTFTISGNGTTNTYSVKSGEEHIVPVPMPIKIGEEYTVTETGVGENSKIPFEYYDAPEYTVKYNGTESKTNKFVITEQHGDMIDIVIKNNLETASVNVSKVWNDGDNRDGLRKNYDDLYVAVKDGDTYVAMAELDDENKDYEFDGLYKNRNGAEIAYTVVEAKGCAETDAGIACESEFVKDDDYVATVERDEDTGVYTITNTHEPEKTKLTIKKKWDTSAGTLPTVTPEFVTVEVSNDAGDPTKTVTLRGDAYSEWTGEFEGYTYKNGKKVNYTVTEKEIGTNGVLNSNNTLYVYANGVLEGKWVATHSGAEVTNTWTPSTPVYTGAGKFYIEKLDQDGEVLSGVTFTVGEDEYTTGDDGKVEVEFSASADEPEDEYTFEITETSAPNYYDLIDGTEILIATVEMDVTSDEVSLTNIYTKTFSFEVDTAVDGYAWRADDLTLTATDQALADELKIEKTFEGISAEAFKEKSQIKFTVSGPEGFTEMTVGIGDDECEISDTKLICTISGEDVLLPIGEYTVTETDAGIENFTYTGNPTSGEMTKTVVLGGTATFEFENIYEPAKTASFKVKKVWEDDSDRDGIRPDTLEVTLLADGEAYGDSVELKGNDWEYEWTGLPLVNEDAEVIEWSASEEDLGDDYESDEGEMKDGVFTFTNTHTPETKKIKIKKVWDTAAGSLPTSNPQIITVILSNDKDDETQTVTLEGNGYGEWESEEIEVLVYMNQGETITYQVRELEIDGNALVGENEDTLYIYDGELLEGKWVAEADGLTVTNTWTPATPEYEVEDISYFIKKVNEDGEALEGVKFEMGDEEYVTDEEGKIEIVVPVTTEQPEDEFEYIIGEKETLDGYDMVDGTATIMVICTSEFVEPDEENLVNKYVKTCEFEKSGEEAFVWDEDARTLTLTNVRTYVPPVDPCAEGGCGGETTPAETPNTGRVAVKSGDGVVALWVNNAIGGAMMVLIGVSLLALGRRKEVELTK